MLKALRQKKADALARADAIHRAAQIANRDLTKAERTEYNQIMGPGGSIENLNDEIKVAEQEQDERRNTPSSQTIVVGDNRALKKPWRSFGEQMGALASSAIAIKGGFGHKADARIVAAMGTSEGVPSDGGFLIQPEYEKDIMQRVYDTGQVANLIGKKTMNSETLHIPAVDEDSRVDGSRWGGILSYWLAEAQNYTQSKPKFRQIQLTAHKLIALVYATEELLADTAMLDSYLSDVVPQELAFQLDGSIISGSGAGQPLGILNAPSTITQPYASGEGTSGTAPSAADILNMWSRLYAPYRKDAVWLINQSIEPGLIPLTIGAPSLGQILIYTAPGVGGNASGRGMMLGRPVIPIEQSAAVGTAGDIILWSPSGYLMAMRQELRADSSMHVAFLTGEMAFRFMLRADGQPWWKKPLQPFYSAGGTAPPTLSSQVVLQTR
jgi:HK97 family phage major capsid protein